MASRQGQRQSLLHLVDSQGAAVEQQSDKASGQQTGKVVAIGRGQQCVPPQLLGLFPEQPDCGVHRVDQLPVPVGCFRPQPAQGNGKPRAGSPQEGRDHIPQAPGVGAAHVAVAIRLHEIGKRFQQPRDVGLGRRPDIQKPQQFGHGRGQVGGQRPVHASSHPG